MKTAFGSFEPKKFIMFLKFFKFTTSLDYKTKIVDGDSYQIIIFSSCKNLCFLSYIEEAEAWGVVTYN